MTKTILRFYHLLRGLTTTENTRDMLAYSLWSLVGNGVAAASTLLTSIVAARFMGKNDYGLFSLVQNTYLTFLAVVSPALGLTATRLLSQHRSTSAVETGELYAVIARSSYIVSFLISVALWIASPYLSNDLLSHPEVEGYIRVVAVAFFFFNVNGTQIGALAGIGAFRSIAVINFARGMISFFSILWLLNWKHLDGAILSFPLTGFICWLLTERMLRKEMAQRSIPIATKVRTKSWVIHTDLSLPLILSSLVYAGTLWVTNIMLVRNSADYAELAIFSAANQWRWLILFVSIAVMSPMVSSLSSAFSSSHLKFRQTFLVGSFSVVGVSSLVALLVFFYPDEFMALFGKEFDGHSLLIRLVVIASFFDVCGNICQYVILSVGNLWWKVIGQTFWAIVLLTSFSLIWDGSTAWGLAFATVLAYAAQLLIWLVYSSAILRRHAKVKSFV